MIDEQRALCGKIRNEDTSLLLKVGVIYLVFN